MLEIEAQFGQLIGLAMRGKNWDELDAAWRSLKTDLEAARAVLAEHYQAQSAWSPFLQSFLILLREGIEALLVVSALAAYLRRVGAGDRLFAIWWGCGLAIAASLGVAYLLAGAARIRARASPR